MNLVTYIHGAPLMYLKTDCVNTDQTSVNVNFLNRVKMSSLAPNVC